MSKTLTITELSKYLKDEFSKSTLERMITDGRFPVKPIPKTKPRRWRAADVEAWLDGGRV